MLFSAVNVIPICIYTNKAIKKSVEMLRRFDALGWGLKKHVKDSEILQTITLNQLDKDECRELAFQDLLSSQICAGSPNDDTWVGDSGGPLINKLQINNQIRTTQLGIVSFGRCDLSVYTDVTSFVDWIQETINSSEDQQSGQE
ncbi:mast cell protease 3-like [Drosophila rhopaloa]|uniref:Peptidase S1 domain-containing protein n=1 Tax=Drosophila rhopaloa TaxID=1041015 RepID=A0ABM5J8I1_DRORH|nr:mast cell protease 3-like [Drosophila rhopaloa]